MKQVNIRHLIELLEKCEKDGCKIVYFKVESIKKEEADFYLSIIQDDDSVIVTTQKV